MSSACWRCQNIVQDDSGFCLICGRAAPKSLTINMEGIGMTDSTHTWTSSGWPTWWEPETTYAFSDGRELKDGEDFPS